MTTSGDTNAAAASCLHVLRDRLRFLQSVLVVCARFCHAHMLAQLVTQCADAEIAAAIAAEAEGADEDPGQAKPRSCSTPTSIPRSASVYELTLRSTPSTHFVTVLHPCRPLNTADAV